MKKLAIVMLLALLVMLVAGCAKQPVAEEQVDTTPTVAEPADSSTELDSGVSEVDTLSEDVSSDDVEEGLADLDPDEMADFDF